MIIKKFFLLINIIFFIYYGIQLLIYTDEFAVKNLGFFNHAVAGLSEIIGIVFLSFSLSLIIILFRKIEGQFPFVLTRGSGDTSYSFPSIHTELTFDVSSK